MQMRRQFRFNVALNEEKKIEESNKAIDRSTNTRGHTHVLRESKSEKKRNGYFQRCSFCVLSMCVCGSAFGVCVSESFPSPLLASHIIYSSQKLLFTNCLQCVSNMIKWNNTICEKNAHMNKLESPELRFVSFQFVVRALCVCFCLC